MTKLQKLIAARNSLYVLDDLIRQEQVRAEGERQLYQQRKARGQCTQSKSCKRNIVPMHTMCSYHLRKAAEASNRKRVKK